MKLKIVNRIGLVLLLNAVLIGCDKKLNIDPRASLAPETVTSADVALLFNGVYDALQNGGTNFYYLSYATEDLSADNLRYRATFFQHGEVDNNAILTNNVLTDRYFTGPYVVIQRANDLIGILTNATNISEDFRKKSLGEARLLRAYGYYRLVTLFGGVPIVTDRDVKNVPRNTEDEVYQQIIDDLVFAKDNSAPIATFRRGSAEAAKALLARVYLIRKNYPLAKQYADEVIGSSAFALSANYNAVFDPPYSSTEAIFSVTTTVTEGENSLSFFLQHPTMAGSGRAELPVDIALVNAYETGDVRKAASVKEIVAPASNPGWYVNKMRDPGGNAQGAFFILRIAEMYLTSAEAQFMISNNTTDAVALGRINAVRTIRGLDALTAINIPAIAQERRVELAFEGLRWTDMKRLPSAATPSKSMAQVFVEGKGRTINDLLYPIPQSSIDVNSLLVQNPGY